MEYGYLTLIALCCLLALTHWRAAIYFCLVIDVVRDPVRKLVDEQPVWITIAGAVPWIVIMLRAFSAEQHELRAIFQRYPQMIRAVGIFTVALVPGFILACILYPSGYLLALIGMASYLGPFIGLALGYLFIRNEQTVLRFFAIYVLINTVSMVGTPLEFLHLDYPGLGGIRVEWIRYREGYIVDLISGFYRSPDIMGLHAAHLVVFSLILASRARLAAAFGWLILSQWGMVCVVLCGRRKMIAIPIVFVLCYLALSYYYGTARRVRALFSILILCSLVAGLFLISSDQEWNEYAKYASTTLSESPDRVYYNVIDGAFVSVRQSGLLGGGLGTATQGRYYLRIETDRAGRGWQEDAVSRLLLEAGVPGFLMVMIAGWYVATTFTQSIALVPRESSVRDLQLLLLSVAVGDLASFVMAHQHFSGDPVSALVVTVLAGSVLGAPRVWAKMAQHPTMAI